MGFYRYTYAVFGAMHDKDIVGVVAHLKGEIDHWCLTDLPLGRAASAQALEATLREAGVTEGPDSSIRRFATPAEAFQDASSRATEDDRIIVFGSFYTVAGVMAYRKSQQH
jgi:dihydrofolate synthase/folylpolyglutamate synthase